MPMYWCWTGPLSIKVPTSEWRTSFLGSPAGSWCRGIVLVCSARFKCPSNSCLGRETQSGTASHIAFYKTGVFLNSKAERPQESRGGRSRRKRNTTKSELNHTNVIIHCASKEQLQLQVTMRRLFWYDAAIVDELLNNNKHNYDPMQKVSRMITQLKAVLF